MHFEKHYFAELARSKFRAAGPFQLSRRLARSEADRQARETGREGRWLVDNRSESDVKSRTLWVRLTARRSLASGDHDGETDRIEVMLLMLKTAPFFVAVLAVVFTLSFPSPKDIRRLSDLLPPPTLEGLQNAPTGPTEAMLAADTPVEPFVTQIEASGCLDQLAILPKVMIEHCSSLVAEAVIQIAEFEGAEIGNATSESALLVERLRLAAANVCRARWISEPSLTFDADDPVCAVSTIDLASID